MNITASPAITAGTTVVRITVLETDGYTARTLTRTGAYDTRGRFRQLRQKTTSHSVARLAELQAQAA